MKATIEGTTIRVTEFSWECLCGVMAYVLNFGIEVSSKSCHAIKFTVGLKIWERYDPLHLNLFSYGLIVSLL